VTVKFGLSEERDLPKARLGRWYPTILARPEGSSRPIRPPPGDKPDDAGRRFEYNRFHEGNSVEPNPLIRDLP